MSFRLFQVEFGKSLISLFMQQIISNLVWTTKQTAKITFGRDKQHWLLLSVSTRYIDHDNTPCSDSSFFQCLLYLHITCTSNVLDRPQPADTFGGREMLVTCCCS